MSLQKEIKFEDEICEHLSANGWLCVEEDAADYDRQLALFPDDVLTWVQETQPDAWEVLTKNHGEAAGATLLEGKAKATVSEVVDPISEFSDFLLDVAFIHGILEIYNNSNQGEHHDTRRMACRRNKPTQN